MYYTVRVNLCDCGDFVFTFGHISLVICGPNTIIISRLISYFTKQAKQTYMTQPWLWVIYLPSYFASFSAPAHELKINDKLPKLYSNLLLISSYCPPGYKTSVHVCIAVRPGIHTCQSFILLSTLRLRPLLLV